jgi:hypothetical protein
MRCVAVTKRQFDSTRHFLLFSPKPKQSFPLPVKIHSFLGQRVCLWRCKEISFSFVLFSGFVLCVFVSNVYTFNPSPQSCGLRFLLSLYTRVALGLSLNRQDEFRLLLRRAGKLLAATALYPLLTCVANRANSFPSLSSHFPGSSLFPLPTHSFVRVAAMMR